MNPLVSFHHLYKSYPILGGVLKRPVGSVRVLNGIQFGIQPGEVTGLVGESGCGKSTLAKLMIKLEEPTQGEIRFDGVSLGRLSGREKKAFYRQVQMVFQDPFSSLNPRMKVGDIIGEMIRIQGVDRNEEENRVRRLLEQVEMPVTAIDRFPHEFSGGQRQRIAIARALVVEPRLLIADEPVSALDLALQIKTLDLLKSLKQAYDLTIFLISHDLKKVAGFCDRVAVMYLGRIVEELPGDRLLTDVHHPYSRALIEAIPVADPDRRRRRRKVIQGEVPSPIELPTGCAFHPRCPHRFDLCRRLVPPLMPTGGPGHRVACFLNALPSG